MVLGLVDNEVFVHSFKALFIEISNDKVRNVRITVAKIIKKWKKINKTIIDQHWVQEIIHKYKVDPSKEVRVIVKRILGISNEEIVVPLIAL